MEKGIYKVPLDYRFIKHIRLIRNKTLAEFSNYMNVDIATISRLENNKVTFTPFYESKLREALRKLKVSNAELLAINNVIEIRYKTINIKGE
nr:helix-turn-helix transcriptional regulator [Lysinibacillus endophyticus]